MAKPKRTRRTSPVKSTARPAEKQSARLERALAWQRVLLSHHQTVGQELRAGAAQAVAEKLQEPGATLESVLAFVRSEEAHADECAESYRSELRELIPTFVALDEAARRGGAPTPAKDPLCRYSNGELRITLGDVRRVSVKPVKPAEAPPALKVVSETAAPSLIAFWEDQVERFGKHQVMAEKALAQIAAGTPGGTRFFPIMAALLSRRLMVHLEEIRITLESGRCHLPSQWAKSVAAEVRAKFDKSER